MAEEIKTDITEITQISENTKAAIKRKTAEMLPNNPTAAGMKADDIKAAFFKGMTDSELSILAELARVITEANAVSSNEKTARENADNALREDIMEAVAELDGALKSELLEAVKEYAVKKCKYTDSVSNAVDGDKVYCVGRNGDKLIPLKSDALSYTVAVRDASGRTKTSSPQEGKDAANKEYVDGCIKAAEKRIVDLERMASGYIYNDVIDNGRAHCVQLPKVCNYGILSEVSGNLQLVEFFLPYSFKKAVNVESHTENSFVGVAGKSSYIPCKIPAGAEVTVKCEGDGGTVATHFGLFAAAISSSVVVSKTALGARVTPSSDVNYIYIYCTNPNDTDKNKVKNLEVIFTNPGIVHNDISTPADQLTITTLPNILIPQNLISFLSAYDYGARVDDDCYNYIDFTNKLYYHLCTFTDGTNAAPSDMPTAIDISSYLGDISDVVKLKPGCIMSFWDTSFNRLDANYQLSYKQMLL